MSQPYEILIRFKPDGSVAGCHQQRMVVLETGREIILDPQPVAIDDLAALIGVETAGLVAENLALQTALDEAVLANMTALKTVQQNADATAQIMAGLTAENVDLINQKAALAAEIEALKTPLNAPKTTVTMAQARLALMAAGLFKKVEDGLNALPEPQKTTAKTAWEYSPNVSRTGTLITTLAGLFGLSEADLDQLFAAAAAIEL